MKYNWNQLSVASIFGTFPEYMLFFYLEFLIGIGFYYVSI